MRGSHCRGLGLFRPCFGDEGAYLSCPGRNRKSGTPVIAFMVVLLLVSLFTSLSVFCVVWYTQARLRRVKSSRTLIHDTPVYTHSHCSPFEYIPFRLDD